MVSVWEAARMRNATSISGGSSGSTVNTSSSNCIHMKSIAHVETRG